MLSFFVYLLYNFYAWIHSKLSGLLLFQESLGNAAINLKTIVLRLQKFLAIVYEASVGERFISHLCSTRNK